MYEQTDNLRRLGFLPDKTDGKTRARHHVLEDETNEVK